MSGGACSAYGICALIGVFCCVLVLLVGKRVYGIQALIGILFVSVDGWIVYGIRTLIGTLFSF